MSSNTTNSNKRKIDSRASNGRSMKNSKSGNPHDSRGAANEIMETEEVPSVTGARLRRSESTENVAHLSDSRPHHQIPMTNDSGNVSQVSSGTETEPEPEPETGTNSRPYDDVSPSHMSPTTGHLSADALIYGDSASDMVPPYSGLHLTNSTNTTNMTPMTLMASGINSQRQFLMPASQLGQTFPTGSTTQAASFTHNLSGPHAYNMMTAPGSSLMQYQLFPQNGSFGMNLLDGFLVSNQQDVQPQYMQQQCKYLLAYSNTLN